MKDCPQILYTTDVLPADDVTGRMSRGTQSAAATRLLEGLGGPGFVAKAHSKSHSRAAVAAAAGNMSGLMLGIDIEWIAPHRPFAAIARGYLGIAVAEMEASAFYRGWTFLEAYYKAFQRFPASTLIASAIAQDSEGAACCLDDGVYFLHRRVAELFQLCLVWRPSASEDCVPTFAPQSGRADT